MGLPAPVPTVRWEYSELQRLQRILASRQQALFLDEVDEHQAVEHERSVPLAVGLRADALDEGEEI